MQKPSIFEYKDYKKFLIDWMDASPQGSRGLRKKIAEIIRCQTAYITQVLSGAHHFSLEQGELLSKWLKLSSAETEYLFLLILHARAGTKTLQKHFLDQITLKREQEANLQKKVNLPTILSEKEQMIYYSSWHYAAIHICLLNPKLRTAEALQLYLKVDISIVQQALDFLLKCGLISTENGIYKVVKSMLHLELDSLLIKQHHTNWRLKTIESLSTKKSSNLHYSGIISLSHEDYEWVRDKLSQFLKETVDKVRSSDDQTTASLNFDWFEL